MPPAGLAEVCLGTCAVVGGIRTCWSPSEPPGEAFACQTKADQLSLL